MAENLEKNRMSRGNFWTVHECIDVLTDLKCKCNF